MGGVSVLDSAESLTDSKAEMSLVEKVAHYEISVLQEALLANEGRLVDVQQQLGLPRKTLYDKMRKYGLEKDDYKQ